MLSDSINLFHKINHSFDSWKQRGWIISCTKGFKQGFEIKLHFLGCKKLSNACKN